MPCNCFDCGTPMVEHTELNHVIELSDGDKVILPETKYLRCPACGEELYAPEHSTALEAFVETQRPGYFGKKKRN